jgi:VWFA-related protein
MTRRHPLILAALPLLLLPLLAAATWPGGQERSQEPPTFKREVEVVTVDVVVVNKAGNPITGLTREDFTIQDEGVRQTIVNFDVVALPDAPAPAPAGAPRAIERPRVATNSVPRLPGRTFVVVFDNINMSPLNTQRAKAAVVAFLEKGLRDGDRVMIAATAGGAWWTATMPEGREDVIAVLRGLDGRRFVTAAYDRMADFEAMRIYQYSDHMVARRVLDRFDRYGVKTEVRDQRQIEAEEISIRGRIDPFVDNKAAETYIAARTRFRSTLGAIERLMKPLADTRDRKAVLLVSEGFVYDPNENGHRRVVEAARRANAALYFIDTRGLADLPGFYSAQFGERIDEKDVLAAIADTTQDAEGAATLARDTGGFVVAQTNDLEAGIVRIASESRSFYLLGYAPGAVPRDGRFRKIEVRVRRKDAVVRARRGYFAPSDVPDRDGEKVRERMDPEMQYGLDSPNPLDAIPLRMTTYVLEGTSLGRARVLVAADADISKVDFQETAGRLLGALDTLAVAARRENSEVFRADQKVDLERKPGPMPSPSWYTIVRELELPPGTYHAKVVVRDPASRRLGTVSLAFDVPPLDRLRLSSPILTDAIQVPPGGAPSAVLLARRTFSTAKPLFCRFDVHGAASDPATHMPRVVAGHVLRRADGTVLGRGEPTEIAPTSLGGIFRLMQIPLGGMAPGDYELELFVRDVRSGTEARVVEPFTLQGS